MSTSSFHDPYAARGAATGPDAELIYLHAECVRLEAEFEAACLAADRREQEVLDQLPPLPTEGDTNAEAEREAAEESLGVAELNRARDAINDAVNRAMARLAAKPAQTIVGVHLKLDFARYTDAINVGKDPAGDLVTSALRDAERLAEVTDTPDPALELITQIREGWTHAASLGDEESEAYANEHIVPLEAELYKASPTTRAGAVAVLNEVLELMEHSSGGIIPVLVKNVRDALAGAAPGAPAPLVDDPILGLIAALKDARAAITAKQERDDRPEDDDAYLEAEFTAADLAEEALIKIEPRTMAGFAAKAAYLARVRLAYLARVRLEADGIDYPDYAEAVQKYGSLSCKALIAAFARDAAALSEWHVAPGGDATNEGSDA